MHRSTLTDLYRHMEWADATVWAAVLSTDAARRDDKLRGTLYHLHMVQRAFLRVWRGEPRDIPYPTFDDADSLKAWARTYYVETADVLGGYTDEQLAAVMPVPWASMVERRIGRPPGPTSMGETALQVALHTQYHRGQVNARLREVGGTPPLVDYIAWVWLGRPAAEWRDEAS
ncbi:MAG TPA: DinB family protein [Blastocatellia bacterium]|nr:DinB family protein [Blastocatellia bacterium]